MTSPTPATNLRLKYLSLRVTLTIKEETPLPRISATQHCAPATSPCILHADPSSPVPPGRGFTISDRPPHVAQLVVLQILVTLCRSGDRSTRWAAHGEDRPPHSLGDHVIGSCLHGVPLGLREACCVRTHARSHSNTPNGPA